MPKASAFILTLLLVLLAACTDGDRMRRELAQLEARNQADSLLTDSAVAQRLADYFDRHGTQNERLEAHYLLARTWADLGQAPRALDAFHTAAEQADTTHLDSLSCHFLSRIYGQMGGLFYDYHLHRNALEAFVKAGIYADNANEEAISVGFLGQRSHCLYHLGMKDSATIITKEVVKRLLAMKDTLSANTWLGPLICDYLEKEKYTEADSCLYLYQHHSYVTPEALQHYEPWKLLYVYIGNLYLGVHQPDSALSAFYKELNICNSYNNKGLAYHGLYQTYTYLHKPDSVQKYALLYAEMNDSTEKSTTATALLSMQHLYDYSHFQTIADRKAIEAGQANRRALMLAIALLLFVAIVYNWLVRYRAHVKLIRQQMNARYVSTLLAYNTVKSELQRETQQNIAWRKQAETELEQLRAALTEAQNDGHIPEQWDIDDKLFRSPVLVQSHQAAIQGRRMPDNIWMELRRLVNREMPGFMEKLSAFAYKPDMTETQIIILLRLRFILSEISVLLDIKSSNLSAKRRRLLKKMFGIDGSASQFDTKIRQL